MIRSCISYHELNTSVPAPPIFLQLIFLLNDFHCIIAPKQFQLINEPSVDVLFLFDIEMLVLFYLEDIQFQFL